MKTDQKLPVQTKPKSVLDMTPFELAQIEKFQNRNKGFREYDDTKSWAEEMEDLNHSDNEIDW